MKFILVFIISGLICSCATHKNQAYKGIDVGMDKSDVLEKWGSPTRKDRMHGQDRWVFIDPKAQTADATVVFFHEGKVTYVGPEHAGSEAKPDKASDAFKTIQNQE